MRFLTKTAVETIFTPITHRVAGFLKKAENEDFYDHFYDRNTDFNPFRARA